MYVKKNERIRIKDTLIANMYTFFLYLFATIFLILGLEAVKTLEDQTNYLLGILIVCMAVIRVLSWAGRPTIYLNEIRTGDL